ncbi:MAG TPA: hypothetical protein VIT20_10190 [Propionibacteriaceae bacterium]
MGSGDEAARSTIATLIEGHWYDAVAALLDGSMSASGAPSGLVKARDLAAAARRVLDLDAEDFASIAHGFTEPWAARLAESSFPVEPLDPERGALGSLVPLYELMLEVLEVRAQRREPLQVVVSAHLIGEYLTQLAWESTLGHGGDPMRMAEFVGGSRWGTDDPACPHSSALRSTAKRALHATKGDVAGFTAYLDRFHSRLGDALGVCAMNHATIGAGERPDVGETCANPCAFVLQAPLTQRRDLDARVRLAKTYIDSPIVNLRHHAPVGHFFGVPSVQEISEAWLRTWERLTVPWADGANPLLAEGLVSRPSPHEALPGMSALVSAVAGRPMGPGRLLHDIGHDVARALHGAPASEVMA